MGISTLEFEYLQKLMLEKAAIVLDDDKRYLAESRLTPLVGKEGFSSVQGLLAQMRTRHSQDLNRKVLDAMTNNETWFFRDADPFDGLRMTILGEVVKQRHAQRRIAIWSAASSSGQEAYSIAMLIREHFPGLLSWDLRILGTDISTEILRRARNGRYSQLEVNRGLPVQMLAKYFEQRGLEWELTPSIRGMVDFRQMNLAEHWPEMGKFDIIFLRNVLIYFDVETKRTILSRMARVIAPDGYLFMGCAETTLNLSDEFERVPCGRMFCYRLRKNQ